MKNIKSTIFIIASAISLGVFIGWLSFGGNSGASGDNHNHGATTAAHTEYTCAMHPQIRQNEPDGICPICEMDLTPVEPSGAGDSEIAIDLSDSAMKIAQVETSKVEYVKGGNSMALSLNGKIEIDERMVSKIASYFPARIEDLHVNYTGEKVTKGEAVVSVYSSKLISAQEELLQALKYKDSNPSMYKAARNKLSNWKISDSVINKIEDKGEVMSELDIHSEQSGLVMKLNVSEGDYIQTGKVLFEIADLSKLWVMFDAYEKDLQWVKEGSDIEFTVASVPGTVFEAKVTFIEPVIDPKTRVAKVRAEVGNSTGFLKPEMFVKGTIKTKIDKEAQSLLIPQSAVLWTGKRSLVYVKIESDETNIFEYREITIGARLGEFYEVLDGLEAGEEIVSKGSYTIDAAAQLAGKASMMNPLHPNRDYDLETKMETFKVFGNCSMCKETIEGSLADNQWVYDAVWDKDSKMMEITYVSGNVSIEEIKLKIAGVGYDTEEYRADDEVYGNLHGCCQYERPEK